MSAVVPFDVGAAVVSFFGATALEDEFSIDARRVALEWGHDPTGQASVTWSGPNKQGAYTAWVRLG